MYLEDKKRRYYVAGRLRGKESKEEAKYRSHSDAESQDTCFECANYEQPGEERSACRVVAGIVSAEDTCDLWMARTEQSAQPSITIKIGKG